MKLGRRLDVADCGTDGRAAWQTEAGDNDKGGYRFMEP